ncbi:ABC transporter ATP-binding protein [Streptomyces sp. NRRL F-5126]|uniref:ABC transporter ATP-binding protein n=1 Tax=Streptomyces sp. NRRL F-5126 TaxID=1463857 RepID=UPI00068C0127|nr:ATP-binding cassette domain-containing protein [Streptomyces sp. NRRL F-5126]
MAELRFSSVSVRYGPQTVVRDVSIAVASGGVLGLVGESGSGKSSLARAAVGLASLAQGRISVDGAALATGRGRSRAVQMIFQDPFASLDPRMSIGATIAEALPASGRRPRSGRAAEVARLLDLVGLDPARAGSRPGQLSGGQRQRVAIARALAARPAFIIADEITSALDVSVQGAILNLIKNLRTELGLGLLFISHNISVVRYVSDTIAVMWEGALVETGPAERVLASPQHAYTRELLATARDSALTMEGS